ncbi:MAG: ATP-binding cassette domain-containing protein [Candidatus Competibacterales bacterium]
MLNVTDLTRPGLDIASLTVADGECVVIMGPSGAGKSLLLRAIADLDPNAGQVVATGIDRTAVTGPQWRRRVVFVAAESGWWAETVGAHFDDPPRATPLVTALGLPAEALKWPVSRLSSGERQRLALARALALEPPVLLLDEPTAALDQDNRQRVETLLQQRLATGLSLLLVTHDHAQARRLGRRVLGLEGGRLV